MKDKKIILCLLLTALCFPSMAQTLPVKPKFALFAKNQAVEPIETLDDEQTIHDQDWQRQIDAENGGEIEIPDGVDLTQIDDPSQFTNIQDDVDVSDGVDDQIIQVPLGAIAPATIEKFVKVIDTVRQEYVSMVDDDDLFKNAIMGVLYQLDPYSEYLDREAYENLRLFTEGDMGSIGATVSFDDKEKHWVFDEVLSESPAEKAGVRVQYYLHQINDTKLHSEQTQQDVNQLLSGLAGSQIRLTVSNQGRRKRTLVLQRSLIQQQQLQAKVVDSIAVVHIPIFQNNTQQQFVNAMSNLSEPFSGLVLDLRNNPGGVLSSANDMASLFMKDKMVAQVHGKQGLQEIVKTHGESNFANVPLVVLQNRYSASAAEVLSSALQENHRAKILGETSYGKGSIQTVVPISDDEAVKLTVSFYQSGQGKKIDGVGVVADQNFVGNETTWEQQAIDYLLTQPRPLIYRLKPTPTPQEF